MVQDYKIQLCKIITNAPKVINGGNRIRVYDVTESNGRCHRLFLKRYERINTRVKKLKGV